MRTAIILALLMFQFHGAAFADTEALRRCRSLVADTARLACYDAIALPATAAPAASSPAAVPAATQFGLPQSQDRIESRIEGRFEGWSPRSRIRLANGQVWQVVDDSSGSYWLDRPRAVVRRGAFGSFVMDVEGANVLIRVRRVE
jgi:hypothetical protein